MLIDNGVDVNMVVDNEQGEQLTALDIAEGIGETRDEVAEMLRAAGARRYADLASEEEF